MSEIITVNIGEIVINNENKLLGCIGIGSCVCVAIYDEEKNINAMAHIMMPSYSEMDEKNKEKYKDKKLKYADKAIEYIVKEMKEYGCKIEKLKAKIAGGATMFSNNKKNKYSPKVGKRNVKQIERILKKYNIKLLGKDVGGTIGRTVTFNPETKKLTIKTIDKTIEI